MQLRLTSGTAWPLSLLFSSLKQQHTHHNGAEVLAARTTTYTPYTITAHALTKPEKRNSRYHQVYATRFNRHLNCSTLFI
jgi:hypothetical protein